MEIADRIIYMENGRIAKKLSVEAFGDISEKKRQCMGIRSLQPSFALKIPVSKRNHECIEFRDFYFAYGKYQVLNIPKLSIPKGGVCRGSWREWRW